jgi:hypothetical protein
VTERGHSIKHGRGINHDRELAVVVDIRVRQVMQRVVNPNTVSLRDVKETTENCLGPPRNVRHHLAGLPPLISKPGCTVQPKHCNFDWHKLALFPQEAPAKRMTQIPYSFVMAIDPSGANLIVRPYGKTDYQTIFIPQGAMTLFAGDLGHGGGRMTSTTSGSMDTSLLANFPEQNLPLCTTFRLRACFLPRYRCTRIGVINHSWLL